MNALYPEPRKVQRVASALRDGEIVAYPTDTVYGLGCDLMNKRAVERLYDVKRMEKSHHLAFICSDLSSIARYAIVENHQYRILKRYLPGPYCFILEATREVPRLVQTKRKTVGIRVPDHAVIRAVTEALGSPIISTTAQHADSDAPEIDPRELDARFQGVGLVIDTSEPGGLTPTTVIDLTQTPPVVVRKGAGDTADFED